VYEHGDDYLHKPFELPELVAKLRALSRAVHYLLKVVTWRDLELVLAERKVCRGDKVNTAKRCGIRDSRPFHAQSWPALYYDEAIEKVWGRNIKPRSNLLAVHVRNIRQKMGDQSFLETVRGRGYRLIA
jgi:two-component system OmpR family response regulator